MNNTALDRQPTVVIEPSMDRTMSAEVPEKFDTMVFPQTLNGTGNRLPIDELKDEEYLIPLVFESEDLLDDDLLDDDDFVKVEEVKHTELDYELQAALDVALMEDGNGTKRKVAIDFANLADDELFSDDEPVEDNTMTDEVVEEVENEHAKGKQVKNYCFTWNNPTVDGAVLEEKLKNSERVAGYAFQLEEGESGTPHFQGYLQFKNRVRTGAAHKFFAPWRMALIHSKALIAKKAIDYCIKEEGRLAGPWIGGTCVETGKKKGNQGKRTDLDDFAKAVF